jgi:hypothetical protein
VGPLFCFFLVDRHDCEPLLWAEGVWRRPEFLWQLQSASVLLQQLIRLDVVENLVEILSFEEVYLFLGVSAKKCFVIEAYVKVV